MEAAILALLVPALGCRVTWGKFGPGDDVPRVALHLVGRTQDYTMRGAGGIRSTVQLDAYGRSYTEAKATADAARLILSGYRGGVIQGVFLNRESDSNTQDAEILFRRLLTFAVHHRE